MPPLPAELRPEAERMTADLAPDLPPEVVAALVAAWAQLFGLVCFELFGQFNRVVEDREAFFRHAAGQTRPRRSVWCSRERSEQAVH